MDPYGAGPNGFTPAQLDVLRCQIVVYKQLRAAPDQPIPPQTLAGSIPPPLTRAGPLYELAAAHDPTPASSKHGPSLPTLPYALNILPLLQSEFARLVTQRQREAAAQAAATLASPDAAPGFAWRSPALPRGQAALQARRLALLPRQHALRAAVEAAQAEIAAMPPAKHRLLRAHERLARERNKLKGDDRQLRLEALKAHDFEAYQEMLRAQSTGAASAGEKYVAISKFLKDTEEYLIRLASKIAGVKLSAEVSKATADAIVKARAQGLSEEDVQAAAHAAAQDAASNSAVLRAAGGGGGPSDAQSHYYELAHSNREAIAEQPSLLRPPGDAKLREYQLVGLQWMVSLYNNHLNGILADEMGLGKTVQASEAVMALIAYLMEHKSNYGPHLIIVPNAVLVNWKSELTQWLPGARCVYYVGTRDERARRYASEVQSLQFNVLVTTYEFIMRDRAKLAKIDWQYIVIDEAQRMKDRQSKLAKDLDRFTAARRLLLSGTPLQNDLLELWSLLNLLLPEEKRVVVIHRLHQILEPFMLRRQVEDVESKLPAKVAMTVRVPMTPYQSAIYDWVKATGTLRLDPSAPQEYKMKRQFASLNNKCMELRKLCNHPLLSYPPLDWGLGDAIVRQCGKLVVLDRLLVKLVATGHRVLLFSTMTRLLDLLEVYLRRTMGYLRIDGTTALEDRERAIQAFNAPDSDAFVFLLSIRAAGRGLNLQSADTVVIYDPDPNPKNEEQAIASIESLVRNQIQRVKIDMANEVIDAGRFDQQTTNDERRQTLEALLKDEARTSQAQNTVPTWRELNEQLARGPDELAQFEALDAAVDWMEPAPVSHIPPWMAWTPEDLAAAQRAAADRGRPKNVAAELAALTGTEDAVTIAGDDTEEEELGQNLATDDDAATTQATTGAGGAEGSPGPANAQALQHVQSTARMGEGGVGSAEAGPPAKRQRADEAAEGK
ncbi:ATP-dependent helicase BRM [Auxenochlorella protothecoides]|uniref:ATP-dependent helicase BRM n=1 Tax=Auxenochlorella protothecoides TaxID=3075 RepID=A0A087SRV1_AUXPR|nr:ATP-dependent helicase BRM [Auxenochlorella protothecoides]KFM28455.1 ATP-dependent helicase BRM [Auxenochlorella protothecoides]